MLYRLPDSVLVVNFDIADPGHVRAYIYKHKRHLAEPQIIKKRIFHSESKDGNPVDSPFNHAPDRSLHAFRIMRGRGKKYLVIVLDGNIFEGLNNFRKERICDLGDD